LRKKAVIGAREGDKNSTGGVIGSVCCAESGLNHERERKKKMIALLGEPEEHKSRFAFTYDLRWLPKPVNARDLTTWWQLHGT